MPIKFAIKAPLMPNDFTRKHAHNKVKVPANKIMVTKWCCLSFLKRKNISGFVAKNRSSMAYNKTNEYIDKLNLNKTLMAK